MTPPCADGTACTTGNPGACNSGHISCSGNVGTCVPNATTQSCYSGPAGTAGVGICANGVQTCIGTLGPCNGAVLPAAIENCFNSTDDDCNGVVNNGCPDHITTGTTTTMSGHGNGSGSTFSAVCPTGTFVGKVVLSGDQFDGDFLSGMDLYCLTPTLVANSSTSTYSVSESLDTT
jgi:hypothetical protein